MISIVLIVTTLIVVEDDVDSMEVLCEFLQIQNFDIIGRGINGKEGIKLYDQFRSDVVIMDVMMPEYDGFYGLEGIRKIDADATVIMITADLTKDTKEKLMDLNASAILYKPNDLDKIAPTIEQFMEEKSKLNQFQINT